MSASEMASHTVRVPASGGSSRLSSHRDPGPFAWSPVKWREVFGQQPWLLMTMLFVLLLVPSQLYLMYAPARDTHYSQPTETYPGESLLTRPFSTETVPTVLLGVIVILLVLSLGVLEVLLAPRYHTNASSAYHSAVLLLLDGAMVNIIVYAMVSFTKQAVGRLRPDFFARLETGDSHVVTEGHWSYPSGHAATSTTCGTFWALHLTWTFYFRKVVRKTRTAIPQWQADLWSFLQAVLVGVGPVLALFIATSRIYNYRHHPSDVNAGSLMGIIGTCFWWARSIGVRAKYAQAVDEADENNQSTAMLPVTNC